MKVIKSDHRYKLYGKGFHCILHFTWHGISERKLYSDLVNQFSAMFGPTRYADIENGLQVWNDNWRYEANAKAKRRRIYLKDEHSLSIALLKMGESNGS